MPRKILVQSDNKEFSITIPDDATLTFGPWSPPSEKGKGESWSHEAKRGTLRVYAHGKKEILAVFSGVTSFRDISIGFAEKIAVETGNSIWRDDETGYFRESKVQRTSGWITPALDTANGTVHNETPTTGS